MLHYSAQCSHQKMVRKQQYSGRLWRLSCAHLVVSAQSVPRKHTLGKPLSYLQHPRMLIQGEMNPCFHVVYAKLEQKSSLIRLDNVFPVFYSLQWLMQNVEDWENIVCILFLAHRSVTQSVLLPFCNPSVSKFDVLCIHKMHFCISYVVFGKV